MSSKLMEILIDAYGIDEGTEKRVLPPSQHEHDMAAKAITDLMKEAPDTVTRFEVIDNTGRAMTKYGVRVRLSYQDDNRTLKVFLTTRETE